MNKPFSEYEQQIKEAQEAFSSAMEAIADRVREEVVLPVCAKHKLTLTAGNGLYFFSRGKGDYDQDTGNLVYSDGKTFPSKVRTAPRAMVKDLAPVIELLDAYTDGSGSLGAHMRDVTKKQTKAYRAAICPRTTRKPGSGDVVVPAGVVDCLQKVAQAADLSPFSTRAEEHSRMEIRAKLTRSAWKDSRPRLSSSDACRLLEEAHYRLACISPDVMIFLRDLARYDPFDVGGGTGAYLPPAMPTADRVVFPPGAAKAGLRNRRDYEDHERVSSRRELFLPLHTLVSVGGEVAIFIASLLSAHSFSPALFWVYADEYRRLRMPSDVHLCALQRLPEAVNHERVRECLQGFGAKIPEVLHSVAQLHADWSRRSPLPTDLFGAEVAVLRRMMRVMEEQKIANKLNQTTPFTGSPLYTRSEIHVLTQAADFLRLPCAHSLLAIETQLGESNAA